MLVKYVEDEKLSGKCPLPRQVLLSSPPAPFSLSASSASLTSFFHFSFPPLVSSPFHLQVRHSVSPSVCCPTVSHLVRLSFNLLSYSRSFCLFLSVSLLYYSRLFCLFLSVSQLSYSKSSCPSVCLSVCLFVSDLNSFSHRHSPSTTVSNPSNHLMSVSHSGSQSLSLSIHQLLCC